MPEDKEQNIETPCENESVHEECCCHKTGEAKEEKRCKKDKKNEEIKMLNESLLQEKDKYMRLQAEYMNFRTRTSGEIEKMFKYSNETLAVELLPILDNFERAIKMDDNDLSDEVSKFLSGFKMIYTSFVSALNKIGITEIDVAGREFDPHFAEAVLTEEDPNKPAGVVLEVLQKGYMYKDKVIRPAMVKVNK